MANTGEKTTLLDLGTDSAQSSRQYKTDNNPPPPYTVTEEPTGTTSVGKKPVAGNPKRERLQRNPSLEKVDEDLEREKMEEHMHKPTFGCGDVFGVRSYLHHFYDTHFYKDPSIYEEDEDEFRYLLRNNHRRRRCGSIWWKVFVWIGANFLIFGIIGVLVGYLVPMRPIVVGSLSENIEIVDREAISYNFNLDVCKLVGLLLFCVGGLTLTVALLFPSFLYQYFDDDIDSRGNNSFKVRIRDEPPTLKSPLEMAVPACSKLSSVQPDRKSDESVVTQEGMQAIQD